MSKDYPGTYLFLFCFMIRPDLIYGTEVQWQSKETRDRAGGNGFLTLHMGGGGEKSVVLLHRGYLQTRKSRTSPSQPGVYIQFADVQKREELGKGARDLDVCWVFFIYSSNKCDLLYSACALIQRLLRQRGPSTAGSPVRPAFGWHGAGEQMDTKPSCQENSMCIVSVV